MDGARRLGADASCPVTDGSACCWDAFEQHGQPQAECVKGGVSEDGCSTNQDGSGFETRIECQTADNCGPGLRCCGTRYIFQTQNGQASVYEVTSCQSDCSFPDIVLCSTPGDMAGCPEIRTQQGTVQTVCQQSQLLPQGYLVCGFP